MLEVLKPLFERLAPHRQGRIRWLQLRIALCDQHVLPDRAVGWRRALAELDPHDCEAQIESARALGSTGDCEAACASLETALRPESRWLTAETEALRLAYVELLQGDERYPESLDYLAGWVRESPASETVCLGYLKALVLTGNEAQATDTAGRWLAEARRPGPLAADAAARLDAAVSFALGQTSRWRRDRVDERWLEPLAETARFLAAHPSQASVVERILRDTHFGETEPCRRVRAELWQQLGDRLDELSAARIQTLFRWAARGSFLTDQQRQQFARRLEKRWAAETDRYLKNRLGAAILEVLPMVAILR